MKKRLLLLLACSGLLPVSAQPTPSITAHEGSLFRTMPYLQNPVDNGITVMCQTTLPAYCWIEYGTDTLDLQRAHHLVDGQVICNGTLHKIRIDELTPNQPFYYRVCAKEIKLYQAYKKEFGEEQRSPFYQVRLPQADTEDFTAFVFNDLHQRTATFEALLAQASDFTPDLVFFNGDCIDDPANINQATQTLETFNRGVGAHQIPVFYIRGNHEIRNAFSIGLRDLFDYVGDKTYAAFNWGKTRFVILDCGEDKPDDHWVYYGLNDFTQLRAEQVDFLQQEVKSKPFKKAQQRVLLHHIPIFGNTDNYAPCTELWAPILKRAPFFASLSAHIHQFATHLEAKSSGVDYPAIVGGGPSLDSATLMILQKRGKELTLIVRNTKGEELYRHSAN